MALGNFGTIRPADVSTNDIEMFYTFRTSRNNAGSINATQLSSSNLSIVQANNEPLGGMYNLTLPKTDFSQKGIYNIFIRPRQVRSIIYDCGTLQAIPDVKGIIIDRTRPELAAISDKLVNGGLVGFRIEYYDSTGAKIPNLFRIVTSSNLCEAVGDNSVSTTQKTIRYRFTTDSNLIFLTLSPTTAPSVKPTANPFIGTPGGSISIANTYFNPVIIEVELTDSTLESIASFLFANQTISADGIKTYYDSNNQILRQYSEYVIKDETNENSLYRVSEQLTDPDISQDFDTIKSFRDTQ